MKLNNHLKWSVFLALPFALCVSLLSTVVTAQDPQAQQSQRKNLSIEEVIVTARKREESLTDVPLSVSAYTATELKNRQIYTTDQLSEITPNLQFGTNAPSSGHNSAGTIFIRGVGQPDFIPSSDPGVGLYIDGVYIARSVGSATELLDLERIEVLRGPQGTLFGRNTNGGAIILHTRRPAAKFGGDIGVQIGNDNLIEVKGDVSIPLSDSLRMKVTAATRQRDGYVQNRFRGLDLGDDQSIGARYALDWDATDKLNVYWTVEAIRERENGSPTVFNSLNTSGAFARLAAGTAGPPPTVPNFGDRGVPNDAGVHQLCSFRDANGQDIDNTGFVARLTLDCGTAGTFDLGEAGAYSNFANGDQESKLDIFGTGLTVSADVGSLTLKAITGYRTTKYDSKRDADNTPLTILHTENHDKVTQFSQELQLSGSAFDDRLSWLAGLYYFQEKTNFDYPVFLPAVTVGALNTAGKLDTNAFAAFGQVTVDISPRLHATAGIRATKEEKKATPNFFAIGSYSVPNPFSPAPRCGGPGLIRVTDPKEAVNRPDAHCITLGDGDLLYENQQNRLDFSQITPTFSLSFDISNNSLLYLTYAEGFKSGGFSTRIIQPVPSERNPDGVTLMPTFDPEEVKTFEIGVKGQLEKVRISAAAFSTKYQNQHVLVRQGVAPITFNAGKSDIIGFELEGVWTPTTELYITASIGYAKGEYDSFFGPLLEKYNEALSAFEADNSLPAPQNVPGLVDLQDGLAYTPEVTASAGVSYLIRTGAGNFIPRLDYSYRDKVFFDAPNSQEISQGSVNLVNASISWESPGERLEVVMAVKNLTDERYRSSGNISFSSSAYAETAYARPRQWSLSAKLNF